MNPEGRRSADGEPVHPNRIPKALNLVVRIIILHSRYRSGPMSGENRVVQDETRLLREAGHDVIAWTPSVPPEAGNIRLVVAGLGAVWSAEASSQLRGLLRSKPADVVHVHNLFPALSPSVLRTAAAEGASIVATLHNYRLLCLPATFLRDGRPCEDCLGRVPWPGVLHRCYRSSVTASTALATSLTLHRALRTFSRVAAYLAVSEFVRTKHIQAGFEAERIRVKPNFAWPTVRRSGPGDYFLYLGRLSQEKGVENLLQAWGGSKSQLLVVGDGPDRYQLERSASDNTRFMQPVSATRAAELIRGARALVLPSTGYDAAPRSVQESYAAGVPIIASRTGGLPELVQDGRSGFLVPPNDVPALRGAVTRLLDDTTSVELGEGAYRLWAERYTPTSGLRALEDAYAAATSS